MVVSFVSKTPYVIVLTDIFGKFFQCRIVISQEKEAPADNIKTAD